MARLHGLLTVRTRIPSIACLSNSSLVPRILAPNPLGDCYSAVDLAKKVFKFKQIPSVPRGKCLWRMVQELARRSRMKYPFKVFTVNSICGSCFEDFYKPLSLFETHCCKFLPYATAKEELAFITHALSITFIAHFYGAIASC